MQRARRGTAEHPTRARGEAPANFENSTLIDTKLQN